MVDNEALPLHANGDDRDGRPSTTGGGQRNESPAGSAADHGIGGAAAEELRRVSLVTGDALAVVAYILDYPSSHRDGLSSLFIAVDGTIYLIAPHTHAVTASSLLRNTGAGNHLPAQAVGVLTGHTGILRAQIYLKHDNRPLEGVGVESHTGTPPTNAQLLALTALYNLTAQELFAVEMHSRGKQLPSQISITGMLQAIDEANVDLFATVDSA